MSKGRFGEFGGQYISETLMNELIRLEECYEYYKKDKEFQEELDRLLKEYAGRPSLLYYAEKMTKDLGGAKIYLKDVYKRQGQAMIMFPKEWQLSSNSPMKA